LRVTQPLALVLYQKLMPGSQLVNRLQDSKYRVLAISEPAQLLEIAKTEKPLLIFTDLHFEGADVFGAIATLKKNPATGHIPVVGFAAETDLEAMAAAQVAGTTLAVSDAAVLAHLPQLLERALHVE
jgi:PleD family two-component response regulator